VLHQRQNASNASKGARIKINTCLVYIALEYVGTVTFNLGTRTSISISTRCVCGPQMGICDPLAVACSHLRFIYANYHCLSGVFVNCPDLCVRRLGHTGQWLYCSTAVLLWVTADRRPESELYSTGQGLVESDTPTFIYQAYPNAPPPGTLAWKAAAEECPMPPSPPKAPECPVFKAFSRLCSRPKMPHPMLRSQNAPSHPPAEKSPCVSFN
jgi:hypothetical protein